MPGAYHTIWIKSKRVITVLIFTLPFIVLGQQEDLIIGGYIQDRITGEPIENANISIRNTTQGTSSHELGEFYIQVDKFPIELEITHISYESKVLLIDHPPLQPLRIILSPRTEPLPEVVITSQRIDTVFADRSYAVLDYELCDKGILLLIYRARLSKAELLLQDYRGNKLMELKILPLKPISLIRDCLGEVHLLSQEKAFQVAIRESRLELYTPYDIDYFVEVMSDCKFRIDNKVYFERYEYQELVKRFYYVNTLDTTSHLLAITADEEKMGFLRQNPENWGLSTRQAELKLLEGMDGTAEDAGKLEEIRNLNITRRFNKMAYLSKINAPFFPMGDSVVIFNHPGNAIQFYGISDSLLGETSIRYHLRNDNDSLLKLAYSLYKRSKWMGDVIVDGERHKAYTLFQNINGTRDLEEINLASGELRYILNIPFPYVQKIKIKDGFLYYIYKGYGESQKKKLFRQRID